MGGAALGIAGSVTTMFGEDSSFSVQEAKLQMTQLKDNYDTISNLLVLYGEATKDLDSFERKFALQSKNVMDKVVKNYGVLTNIGLNTGKAVKASFDLHRMRTGAETTILSQIVL